MQIWVSRTVGGCIRGLALLATLVVSQSAVAQTFDSSLFFVEEVGDFWVYKVNGVQDSTLRVVGTELIEGVPTTLSRYTGGPFDGTEANGSFDSVVGARLWRGFNPAVFVDGVGFVSVLQEYDPPLLVAPPTITIGEIVTSESPNFVQTISTGSVSVEQPGEVTAQYRYAFVEPVSVPFGTFDAIQVQIQLDLSIEVSPGMTETARVTQRQWIVPGLGVIKLENTLAQEVDVFELTDTNREFVPEPSAALLSYAALLTLLACRYRVRRCADGSELLRDEPDVPVARPDRVTSP
jgi:hypothetical protein